jgi:hypothetical protein
MCYVYATAGSSVIEVSKELGITTAEVIEHLKASNFNVYKVAAHLTRKQADAVRERVDRERRRQVRAPAPIPVPAIREAVIPEPRTQLPPPAIPSSILLPGSRMRRLCTCCGLPFAVRSTLVVAGDEPPERCERCRDHYEMLGESPARSAERLWDHDRRLQAPFDQVSTEAAKAIELARHAFDSRDNGINGKPRWLR